MGFGEVIGNQSVHWRVVHEDHGTPGPPARTRLKDTGPVQGVQNLVVLDFEAQGADGVPFDRIGQGAAGKGHPGFFRVELRFTSKAEADAALAAATTAGVKQQAGTTWVISLDVPAVKRAAGEVGPPARPPAEIRIDW